MALQQDCVFLVAKYPILRDYDGFCDTSTKNLAICSQSVAKVLPAKEVCEHFDEKNGRFFVEVSLATAV